MDNFRQKDVSGVNVREGRVRIMTGKEAKGEWVKAKGMD